MITAIVLCFLCHFARSTPVVSLYADVFRDKDFFVQTFPWIIDNIGGEVTVDYYMLGSGRFSVPQMCALKELRQNAFLQAQYLKCEAFGVPSHICLCETGIDAGKFKECVNQGGYLASQAASKYMALGIGTSPIFELGPNSTIFEVSPIWYLRKLCTIFGEHQPMGCVRPCGDNSTDVDNFKMPVAQFDKDCFEYPRPIVIPIPPNNMTTVTPPPLYTRA